MNLIIIKLDSSHLISDSHAPVIFPSQYLCIVMVADCTLWKLNH